MTNHFPILWLGLLVAILLSSCKPTPAPAEVIPDPLEEDTEAWGKFIDNYENHLKTFFNANGIPGAAVTIVKGDSIAYLTGFGVREKGKSDQVDAETLFRIGSLSKGFASVAVGILVEEGLLSWDERLVDILPNFALRDTEQGQRITVRHILSHSTGLPRHTFTNLVEDGLPLDEIMGRFSEVKLLGQEGKSFGYQNATYSLIQLVVQAKTGKTYEEILREKIFAPGRLLTASTDGETFENSSNHAMPHRRMPGEDYQPVPLNNKYYSASAAGGVNASVTDMAQWLKIVLGGRPDIIQQATLDELFTPVIETPKHEYFDSWEGVEKSSYGMGWRVLDFEGRRLAYHGGLVNQFRCEIALDLENNTGICLLFNTQSFYARIAVPSFLHMYQLYLDLGSS